MIKPYTQAIRDLSLLYVGTADEKARAGFNTYVDRIESLTGACPAIVVPRPFYRLCDLCNLRLGMQGDAEGIENPYDGAEFRPSFGTERLVKIFAG